MKHIKKSLSILLATVCYIATFNTTSHAATTKNTQMDELDILLTANSVLNTEDENYWTYTGGNTYEIIPLFSQQDILAAYYIHFTDGGYAVINNNTENPTVIEFGDTYNKSIRDIIMENPNAHIVYNNPFSIYDAETPMTVSETSDIYENYPDLTEENIELANLLNEQKKIVSNSITPLGDGDYGFIDWNDMPSGSYNFDYLPVSNIDWITTGETSNFAKDHCGAVAVTNLAFYFEHTNQIRFDGTRLGKFIWVHQFVGNGPKMTIAPEAKDFFYDIGYDLKYNTFGSISQYKTAIDKNRPCGILLAEGIVNWHWILGVGWREYSSGNFYMRIVDGWDGTANRFYKPYSDSLWISATEYWL
ncbi:hypothetical protein [Mediterraneibacter gnavus]|uniref:hypothetical protein n=1 Tax=Mediterraneibacter gnavus TaxID=33038 RepID=UPI00046388B7|nr:hypothetical protein [Mediterraneibacter gnavus]